MELSYFNTNHPDFVGGSRAISTQVSQINQSNLYQNQNGTQHPSASTTVPDVLQFGRQLPQQTNQQQRLQQQLLPGEHQLLQETAKMVTGNALNSQSQQTLRSTQPIPVPPHSPQLVHGTGSTTTTTPEQHSPSLNVPLNDASLLPPSALHQPQPSGGFLSFFKGSKNSSVANSSATTTLQVSQTTPSLARSYEVHPCYETKNSHACHC